MSFKTTLAIIITVGLTILIMQNTDEAVFTILFTDVKLPKLVMLTSVSVSAFILGILVSTPSKRKVTAHYDDFDEDEEEDDFPNNGRRDTLSDEDRDYIS